MKLVELLAISGPTPLSELTSDQLTELQKSLTVLGYPVGEIDGLIGPKTRNAWAEFKIDKYPGNPCLVGMESIKTLQAELGGTERGRFHDFSTRAGIIKTIRLECCAQGIGLNTQIAYVLATTQWETAQTFEPVREAFWLSEDWRRGNLRYYPFYGRGYVQLTWKSNYEKYSSIIGADMVCNPDIALQPREALFILVHGFKTGAFTGRKITDYINQDKTDFIRARRCINGADRAHEIAAIANQFLNMLED